MLARLGKWLYKWWYSWWYATNPYNLLVHEIAQSGKEEWEFLLLLSGETTLVREVPELWQVWASRYLRGLGDEPTLQLQREVISLAANEALGSQGLMAEVETAHGRLILSIGQHL